MTTSSSHTPSTGGAPLHTEGVVSDYFLIEGHIISTRSADAYKAVDKLKSANAVLWMLRHPLTVNSEAVGRFLARMRSIEEIDPLVCEMLAYGVDAEGIAFSVFPGLDGFPISSGNVEPAEAERRLTWALRLVDRIHAHGLVCGDLCGSSFWVDRTGDVRFIGVMGSFDTEAAATAMMPPVDTLPFLAPEQRTGGGVEPASDVFALGVLGYMLLTQKLPYRAGPGGLVTDFSLSQVKPISTLVAQPPVWAEEVILRCLDPNPANRYQSAGQVLQAIGDIRTRVYTAEKTPVRVQRDPAVMRPGAGIPTVSDPGSSPPPTTRAQLVGASNAPTKVSGAVTTQRVVAGGKGEPEAAVPARAKLLTNSRLLVLGLVFAVLASGVVLWDGGAPKRPEPSGETLRKDLAAHREAVGDEGIKKAIDVIGESEAALQEKQAQFERIVNSDDPIAHDILVKSARDAKGDKLRALAENSIIDRARRLGMMRSAEQVRQWLRTLRSGDLPPFYEPILQSLDVTLPMEARASALRQAYPSNPLLVLRLASALALDSKKLDEYQPVLAQLIGDSLKLDHSDAHSSLGLILAHPELALVFGDDAIQNREQIPDGDVTWLLKILADRNDLNVRALASLAVERGLLSHIRQVFLTTVRDRTDLDPSLVTALIRGAAGTIRVEDIAAFGRWYDVQSEKILFAVCADLTDPTLLVEAFDTVAGKSLSIEPSASLIRWVRESAWDDRGSLAQAVGILANLDVASDAEVRTAVGAFVRYFRSRKLLNIFIESNKPKIVQMIVEQQPDTLGLGGLLNLLAASDKQVRLTAVKALKGTNDIGALKIIIDYFEKEKDPEVREAYKETFWVIKQREDS